MMTEHTGQQLGPYRLLRLLGQSDWAAVYLGEHLSLHRQVALKVFSLQLTGEEEARFQMEAHALVHLRHPALLSVLDGGVEDKHPFLVLDIAPSGSLRKRHPRGTILPAPIMLSYLHPLAAALQWVHEQGYLHGNIKPENMVLRTTTELLLSEEDLPVLAQHRHSLLQRGTTAVAYLAPEQLHGEAQAASDQYALGVIVYDKKVPTLSSYVEHVVQRALATDPALRFASVQAFTEELTQACQSAAAQFACAPAPRSDGETLTTCQRLCRSWHRHLHLWRSRTSGTCRHLVPRWDTHRLGRP